MKFFIDTANLQEIKEAADMALLDGVTTNPSLMAKEGVLLNTKEEQLNHYKKICDLVDNNVSSEVLSIKFEEMVAEGMELSKISKKIVVKVPATLDGLKAISEFTKKGIRTNCTLIFSATQALLAAKAGASYVSPFLGRLDDISNNGLDLIKDIKQIFVNYRFETNILAASIRNPVHILECAKIGADVATLPLSVLKMLIRHPLTDIGLEKFLNDSKKPK
ncbi:MAG: fructose-6-phosphate aldolase [Solitalea-like symbiont of Tyrophagus putrescentiae]